MTEPTNAELVRRIDDLVRTVERLTGTLEASYVRKEVFEARHEAQGQRVDASVREVADDVNEIKRLREADSNRWKQAMFAIGAQVLLLLILGAFAVSNFMSRTGA